MRRLPLLLLLLSAAPACSGVHTVESLEARVEDPSAEKEERLEALRDLAARRDGAIAQDLVAIAERRLFEGRTARDASVRALERDVGVAAAAALVDMDGRSASPVVMKLGDSESELLRSREALEALLLHPDATVRGLARSALSRLGAPRPASRGS